jgi:hypothetical protein
VKTTLAKEYMPLLNAHWNSLKLVYDTAQSKTVNGHDIQWVGPVQMAKLINEQVYAARRAAESSWGSSGRIGFSWTEDFNGSGPESTTDNAHAQLLAENLATALYRAYSGSTTDGVCTKDLTVTVDRPQPYYGCPPAARQSAVFNDDWNIFRKPWTAP